jgi:hypothetical protein
MDLLKQNPIKALVAQNQADYVIDDCGNPADQIDCFP